MSPYTKKDLIEALQATAGQLTPLEQVTARIQTFNSRQPVRYQNRSRWWRGEKLPTQAEVVKKHLQLAKKWLEERKTAPSQVNDAEAGQ